MGILGLSRLIADLSPEAIREIELKSLFGRRIAIDASMCIYQFLIAIRSSEYMMTNEAGETTSHLVGLFYRTIKLLENGIKPVYVFDGKAPKLKCGELEKRAERRSEAKASLEEAKEIQDVEKIEKFNKRLVKVTRKHNEDCKRLLELLGVPVVQAPSEAEAQCAQLCKEGLVYAIATEDMDALTFGCPRLIRNLTSGNNEKLKEIQIGKVLDGLGLTQDQFIDLSILMGCDYCDNIRGIGGKKGLELIRKFENIEGILKNKFGVERFAEVEIEYNARKVAEEEKGEKQEEIEPKSENGTTVAETKMEDKLDEPMVTEEASGDEEKKQEEPEDQKKENDNEEQEEEAEEDGKKSDENKKNPVPKNWPFRGARQLFQEPLVDKNRYTEADLKLRDVDEEAMVQFLCIENGFNEDRVRKSLKRAKDSKTRSSQTRIDSFFKMVPSANSPVKRPLPNNNNNNNNNNRKPTGNKRGRKAK